ncbi:MAG: hypothetical protein ACHQET_05990 [Chitinophagales bacterium]
MSANTDIPESNKLGKQFKDYLRHHIFVKKFYVSIDENQDIQVSKTDPIEAAIYPDFKFRDKRHLQPFYLEAKFRSADSQEKISWCTAAQLKRYQEFEKSFPVFIVIGLGGKPDNPQHLFLLPLTEAGTTDLSMSTALKFEIPLCKPVMPEDLWKLTKPEYRKAG